MAEGKFSRLGRQVAVGIATAFGVTIVTAIASSDWPPFSSIGRVEGVSSLVLQETIEHLWLDDYCTAERMGNHKAARAVIVDLDRVQDEYSKLNNGREIPLRPCP